MGAARPESQIDKGERHQLGIDEMLTTLRRSDGTNYITSTGGLEYLMLWRVAIGATLSEMAYEPRESLRELL